MSAQTRRFYCIHKYTIWQIGLPRIVALEGAVPANAVRPLAQAGDLAYEFSSVRIRSRESQIRGEVADESFKMADDVSGSGNGVAYQKHKEAFAGAKADNGAVALPGGRAGLRLDDFSWAFTPITARKSGPRLIAGYERTKERAALAINCGRPPPKQPRGRERQKSLVARGKIFNAIAGHFR